jgi:phospholipid/cholesterol/gamma-HCH transport system substrate-binding protein
MRSRRALRALVSVLAMTGAASLLGGCADDSYRLIATFDDVGDLVSRHSVQMADVRVGTITSVKLTDEFKAEVTLKIRGDVRVPKDTTALLRTTSLLGEKFIELRLADPKQSRRGPHYQDGDRIEKAVAGPELEFVAEEAIQVLGAVAADDVAALVEAGAVGFGDRGPQLRQLVSNLSVISDTLADRSQQITTIIDGLDRATQGLAAGSGEVSGLLTNLAETTRLLAEDRQRAVVAVEQLTRLGRVQNEVLDRYRSDIDRQIAQVDAIVAIAAGQTAELGAVVDWLDRYLYVLPRIIPNEFTQIYAWLVPQCDDERTRDRC